MMCCSCLADPAPVTSFHCEVVPKEPTLVLKWACPFGINTGFELEVSHGDWENMTNLESCSSENGSEYRTEVTYLNFSTLYNITVTARSCNKMASPTQNTCLTGITGGLQGGQGGQVTLWSPWKADPEALQVWPRNLFLKKINPKIFVFVGTDC